MSATDKARLLACVAVVLALGCEARLLIGRNCPAGDCDQTPAIDAGATCGVELAVPPAVAVANEPLYRCQLFTLGGLQNAADDDHAYITKAAATMTPYAHEIDVRVTPDDLDVADGPVDCGAILDLPIRWVPLIAPGASQEWDVGSSPLTVSRAQRLLIAERFTNASADPITVAVTLQLECAATKPAPPSNTFEFVNSDAHVVGPAEQLTVTGYCTFTRKVDVWRLFRPTQRIATFTASRDHESRPLWNDNTKWSDDLAPPLRRSDKHGFSWSCGYQNLSDTSFTIGGDSGYVCALMGIYQPVDDGAEAEPLRCVAH